MPMHDWTRVPAGIFHAFHQTWITEITRVLSVALPPDYYALPEQHAAGFGPDVLTLQDRSPSAGGTATLARPKPQTKITFELEDEFVLRKKSTVAVRHVSGDRIAAMIEIVSPGNKNSAHGFKAFVDKAAELLNRGVHLLLIDPFPPGPRDPGGVHAAVAAALGDHNAFRLTPEEPLAFVAYEAGPVLYGYLEPIAVGSPVPDMPVYLEPDVYVDVTLAAAYDAAWAIFPRRWQTVVA